MKTSVTSSPPAVAKLIHLYCNANAYDRDGLREQLRVEKWKRLNPTFLADFKAVIDERLMTIQDYEDLANEDFDIEDELYEHLQEACDHISRND